MGVSHREAETDDESAKGSRNQRSPALTWDPPDDHTSRSDRRIGVVGGVDDMGTRAVETFATTMAALMHPTTARLMGEASRPKFDGRPGAPWQSFVREWEAYLKVLEVAYP